MTVTPAGADYFLEIEAHFISRRKTPFPILSSKDWALMKKWFEDGIPLPVVIEAIDQVFEKNESSGRKKMISSLSYCRHAVKELWGDRRDLRVGEGEATPEENAPALLEKLAVDVEASRAPVAAMLATSIRALRSEKSVPRIEEKLIEIERAAVDEILGALGPDERQSLLRPGTQIADLDEKTRQRTLEANLRRAIRERYALPRLTLFR